jgi:hypothetical protein
MRSQRSPRLIEGRHPSPFRRRCSWIACHVFDCVDVNTLSQGGFKVVVCQGSRSDPRSQVFNSIILKRDLEKPSTIPRDASGSIKFFDTLEKAIQCCGGKLGLIIVVEWLISKRENCAEACTKCHKKTGSRPRYYYRGESHLFRFA